MQNQINNSDINISCHQNDLQHYADKLLRICNEFDGFVQEEWLLQQTNIADINEHAYNWFKIAEEMKVVIYKLCEFKEQKK